MNSIARTVMFISRVISTKSGTSMSFKPGGFGKGQLRGLGEDIRINLAYP